MSLNLINKTSGKSYYKVPRINTLKEMLEFCQEGIRKK